MMWYLDLVGREGVLVLIEELLEVLFDVLEDEVEFLLGGLVDDLLQSHDVGVRLQFLQDADLPHGCGGHTLILVLQLDLLEGHHLLGDVVSGLVDDSIGALSDLLQLLILLFGLAWVERVLLSY